MATTYSPLLAEEQDSDAPALLGAGQVVELEQSPLEQLIARSTSEQAHAAGGNPFLIDSPMVNYAPVPSAAISPSSATQTVGSSLATLLAGSLCLLQMGLVWASFLSDSWFDMHLTVLVDWKQRLPFLGDDGVDQLLQSTTLASLLSTFLGANQHWSAMTLVITSLILPCLCMILCPAWTVGDHQERRGSSTLVKPVSIPRTIVEYTLRLSLLCFFTLVVLDVGTSSLEIFNNHTTFRITNRTRGGLVCYTLGMSCALGVLLILRLARGKKPSTSSETTLYDRRRPRAPPSRAFQLPWRITASSPRSQLQQEQQQALLFQEETDDVLVDHVESLQIEPTGTEEFPQEGLSFCKKVLLYEFGVLATVLWVPALFLPLFQVNFGGLVSSFMEEVSFTVQFWELPAVLWQRGITAGTDRWILIALGTVLLSLVYVLPVLATLLTIGVWRSTSTTSLFCRNVLQFIHPCLCGIVFALSLLLAIPAFEPVGDYLLDEETSGLCQRFEDITDETCLTIRGQHGLGQWFMLAQSVTLEIFILLTLGVKGQ